MNEVIDNPFKRKVRTMLAYAGMPATTANGTERIKDLCRYVSRLDNNQGGAAEIIEKMILLHA